MKGAPRSGLIPCISAPRKGVVECGSRAGRRMGSTRGLESQNGITTPLRLLRNFPGPASVFVVLACCLRRQEL